MPSTVGSHQYPIALVFGQYDHGVSLPCLLELHQMFELVMTRYKSKLRSIKYLVISTLSITVSGHDGTKMQLDSYPFLSGMHSLGGERKI